MKPVYEVVMDCSAWGRKMRREAPWANIGGRPTRTTWPVMKKYCICGPGSPQIVHDSWSGPPTKIRDGLFPGVDVAAGRLIDVRLGRQDTRGQ